MATMNRQIDSQKKRFANILEYLSQYKFATVDDLSAFCNTSAATIRRDVSQLHDEGKVIRVHGGVVYVEPGAPRGIFELSRSQYCREEKLAIGKAAAALINDYETVYLSSGTTTECIIPHIIERQGLTIITRSLNIVARLMEHENINVIMLSGQLSRAEIDLAGDLSDVTITELVSEKIISGAYGLHPKSGLTTSDAMHVKTGRSIIEHMGDLIVLADHTKFTRSGTVQLAPAEAISTIITDALTPQSMVDEFRAQGVQVIVA